MPGAKLPCRGVPRHSRKQERIFPIGGKSSVEGGEGGEEEDEEDEEDEENRVASSGVTRFLRELGRELREQQAEAASAMEEEEQEAVEAGTAELGDALDLLAQGNADTVTGIEISSVVPVAPSPVEEDRADPVDVVKGAVKAVGRSAREDART